VTYSKVVTGTNHACARMTSGIIKCWGDGGGGTLGLGGNNLFPSSRPVGLEGP
jgi:hypothetical protein